MAIEKLVPSANASPATILSTNDYTLIDETVASADASVNATNVDDQTANTATWALADLVGAISTVNSATFRVRARMQSVGDDLITYRFRLTVGATNYDISFTQADTTYSDKTIAVGSFTTAQYNAATVTLSASGYSKTKGFDDLYLEVDALELEVDYVASIPVTATVSGVAATGSVGTVTISAVEAPTVAVTGVSATGAVGAVTITAVEAPTVAVTGVSATGSAGTATVALPRVAEVTGVSATGSAGTASVIAAANTAVSGVTATGSVGTVDAHSSWRADAGHFTADDGTYHSADG